MVCNMDCANCLYDDCINDELTPEDIIRQDKFDRKAEILNNPVLTRRLEIVKKYNRSEKAKANRKRYSQTPKGKERQRRYNQKRKEKKLNERDKV